MRSVLTSRVWSGARLYSCFRRLVRVRMNLHAFRVLEYDKVRDIVASYAASEPGRAEVLELLLQPSFLWSASASAKRGNSCRSSAPATILPGWDPRYLRGGRQACRSRNDAQPAELLNIAVTLGAARRLKTFFQRFEGTGKTGMTAPLLCARAARITPLKHSEDAVHAAVDATTR